MRTQRLSTLSRLLAPPPRLVWDMKRSTPCETCTTENAQRLCTCFTLYASTAVRFPSVSLPNQNVVDMEHKPSSRPLHSILPSVSTVLPRIPETRATCARARSDIERTSSERTSKSWTRRLWVFSAMTMEPRTACGVERTDWVGAISAAKATLQPASSGSLVVVASFQRNTANNANRPEYLL